MSAPRFARCRGLKRILFGTFCLVLVSDAALAASGELPSACAYLARSIHAQPGGPVFLPSFPTAQSGALHGAAYLYDNAVAAIALVGCGESAKASRIGDAIVIALKNDRYWHDGRLRNAYLAGTVDFRPVKLPGWWDAKLNRWMEDGYQVGSDSGNMAWAILALLALDERANGRQYREAAVRLGDWLVQWHGPKGPGGFTGGTINEEPVPTIQTWKSTEQNSDLAAAFLSLAKLTGKNKWLVAANAAESFVRVMWQANCHCFDLGTIEDGASRNRFVALDAQILPLLALPGAAVRYAASVATAKNRIGVDGGFAYGELRGGVWTEGNEQVALFLKLAGRETEARALARETYKLRTPEGAYFASNARILRTGLYLDINQTQERQYFHIPHLASVAWAALVERRFNPFTRNSRLP